MIKIGVDFDDVLAPCNDIAVRMANAEYHFDPPLTLDEVTDWNLPGRSSVLRKYYAGSALFENQTVPQEAKDFMAALQKKGIVYIVTAVTPEMMGLRVRQIREAFPDFPVENIIMGSAKHLIQVDILLDDCPKNIRESNARFPVLFRKPWNHEMTGTLAVNNYPEFLQLLEQIKASMVEDVEAVTKPAVIALVGPSGANKSAVIDSLCRHSDFERPVSYTTNPENGDDKRLYVSKGAFDRMEFFEETMYGGYAYGTAKADIQEVLDKNKFAVLALDMCGAVAMKRLFNTVIIFCRRGREGMVESLLSSSKDTMDPHELMLRIVSMETEEKNADLCDRIVDTDNIDNAVAEIHAICSLQ